MQVAGVDKNLLQHHAAGSTVWNCWVADRQRLALRIVEAMHPLQPQWQVVLTL